MNEHPDRPALIASNLEMSFSDYLEQIEKRTDIGTALYKAWEKKHDSEHAN